MRLKWRRYRYPWSDGYVSSDRVWYIERVKYPAEGCRWRVTEPIDGGYYDLLKTAKADCQRAHDEALRETEEEETSKETK